MRAASRQAEGSTESSDAVPPKTWAANSSRRAGAGLRCTLVASWPNPRAVGASRRAATLSFASADIAAGGCGVSSCVEVVGVLRAAACLVLGAWCFVLRTSCFVLLRCVPARRPPPFYPVLAGCPVDDRSPLGATSGLHA